MAIDVEQRAERFSREVAELKIGDPSKGRQELWVRVGVGLMGLGLLLAVVGIVRSHGTTDPLTQRDALTLGIGGIAASVVGAAVWLRYAVTKVLRFWLARLSFDLQGHADGTSTDRASHVAADPMAAGR